MLAAFKSWVQHLLGDVLASFVSHAHQKTPGDNKAESEGYNEKKKRRRRIRIRRKKKGKGKSRGAEVLGEIEKMNCSSARKRMGK